MSQNDFTIANQTFPNTRSDINSALQALASTSSGSSAPSTTFANQLFYNTTSNLLQIRNEDNDAFITIAELDQTNDTVEYVKSDSVRTALIEFTDGDDALAIADGGALTVSTSLDMNGTELILDVDADTSITADTDDRIDIKVGNTDVAHITKNVIGGIINRQNAQPFIINGNMAVDQRQGGASITANDSTFVVDRWKFRCSQASKLTAEQVTDVPSGQGFYYSTKITSSSALSVGASDFFNFSHLLEGQDIAQLMFGSANAKTTTLTFWVKSSLTGNFAVAYNNFQGSARAYPAEYVINSANTWEKKTVVIAGDTSGTWTATNATGLGIIWNLGYGSNAQGTKNAWNASDTSSFSGAVNIVATSGATLFITGVQLEVGDYDTTTIPPFQHESYCDNLLRCKRYYQQSYTSGTTAGTVTNDGAYMIYQPATGNSFRFNLIYEIAMRAIPTKVFYVPSTGTVGKAGYEGGGDTNAFTISTTFNTNKKALLFNTSVPAVGVPYWHWTASSEL